MCSVNSVSFRSNNYGINSQNTQTAPQQVQQTNFRGGYDVYESSQPKKKTSPLLAIFGILGIAALAIAGMGYAHKTDALSKIKNDRLKDILVKTDPALEKCHEWCAWAKHQGTKGWDTVRGWFTKKA